MTSAPRQRELMVIVAGRLAGPSLATPPSASLTLTRGDFFCFYGFDTCLISAALVFVTDRIIPWVAAGWLCSALSCVCPVSASDTLFDIQTAVLFLSRLFPYRQCAGIQFGLELGEDGRSW